MEQVLAHFEFLSMEGALFTDWRSLASIRELCCRSRNLFQNRLAPIRALQNFIGNAGFEFLRKKDMPSLARCFLESFELTRSFMRSLKEDYQDEGRHYVSNSDTDSESDYISNAINREVRIFA